MTWLSLLKLLFEVVLSVLRHRYDPERLERELLERLRNEREKDQRRFREATAKRDEDTVGRMLARVRDRLRSRRDVPPRE
jgi:hypothetical protein